MKEITCPFCEEGVLKKARCKECKGTFLMCDECEAVYLDEDSLDDELSAAECPHCCKAID